MRPRILTFYIARQFSLTLALVLAGVATVIFLADYVEVLRRFSDETGFTAPLGLQLALLRVPFLLDEVLPFAFLFAALLSLLGLSRKLELVVARASGVSVWGFLRAPFAVALLFGAAAAALLNPVAVQMKAVANNIEAELAGSSRRDDGGHWFRQEGVGGSSIVHSGSVRNDGLTLFGVTAFVFSDLGRFEEKITATRADFANGRWVLADAEVLTASRAPTRLARYELPTELTAEELGRSVVRPSALSLWSLPSFLAIAERTGLNADRFRLAFHGLLNRPLFLMAMVTIAATVSLRLTRYGGTRRLALTGVAAGFLLYVLTEIASDLGGNGIISPVLAAWLPPIVALTFGATTLLFQEDG
ncbi:MAG TPA: LPS export ABC transporter permease LptG [Propylenella sp.]|nr:LPS export ABC transporter permease LptG [Propylenella sp.]